MLVQTSGQDPKAFLDHQGKNNSSKSDSCEGQLVVSGVHNDGMAIVMREARRVEQQRKEHYSSAAPATVHKRSSCVCRKVLPSTTTLPTASCRVESVCTDGAEILQRRPVEGERDPPISRTRQRGGEALQERRARQAVGVGADIGDGQTAGMQLAVAGCGSDSEAPSTIEAGKVGWVQQRAELGQRVVGRGRDV